VPLDQYGEVLLAGSRRLHADTSAAYTEARARSHRPVLPPEGIRYVTDETVCQRIATVLTARAGRGEEPPRPVRVIWEDNGYLATDFPVRELPAAAHARRRAGAQPLGRGALSLVACVRGPRQVRALARSAAPLRPAEQCGVGGWASQQRGACPS
jgi:hypothetical protein